MAMNRLDVVALNTIFALRLSKTRRTVGRADSRLDGWSCAVGLNRLFANGQPFSKSCLCDLVTSQGKLKFVERLSARISVGDHTEL